MSNLLEKASILLTPTGYDDGSMNCIKPNTSVGDFDFTRGTAATRVNSQGLVENVQILSGNLVQNGDFSQTGSELVTNGGFDSDSDWSFIGTANISNGLGNFPDNTNSFIIQSSVIPLSVKIYKIQYEVISTNGNNFRFAGGNSAFGTVNLDSATTGIKTIYLQSNGTFDKLQFNNNQFIGSIDNVSVKEVGQNWTLTSGATIEDGQLVLSASANLYQSIPLTVGKKYRVKYEITSIDAGSSGITVYGGSTAGTIRTQVGIYTEDITQSGSGLLFFFTGGGFNSGTIDNVSVQEVTDDTDLPRINYTNFDYEDVLGDELVTNGNFDTDSDWSKLNATISDGKGNLDGDGQTSLLWQDILTNGKTYKATFTISDYNELGEARVMNNNGTAIYTITSNGTFTINFTHSIANGNFLFRARTGAIFSIDNVSVKELTEDVVVPYSGEGSLLLEPQSTNLLPYSEDFTQWNIARATLTSEVGQSIISGNTNINKLQDSTDNNTHIVYYTYGSFDTSKTYTFSAFLKKGSLDYGFLAWENNDARTCIFNLNLGTIHSQGSSILDAEIKLISNNWYKCSITFSNAASSKLLRIGTSNGNRIYTGSGNDYIYFDAAQLEELSYPTSYIPTSGSTVTRNNDECNNAGSSDLINSTEGVLYAEFSCIANDGVLRLISLSEDGNIGNRMHIFQTSGSNRIKFVVRINNTNVFDETITISNILDYNKFALSYKENEFKIYINGVKEEEQLSGSIYPANTLDKLNFDQGAGAFDFYGNVKCVAVFKEALTDEELTCLTS